MNRRNLLKGMAAGVLQSVAWPSLPALAGSISSPGERLRRTDPGWPAAASWESLGKAVEGNLLRPQALLAPCATESKGAVCADVLKNLRNPFYLGDQVSGTQVSGW